MMKTLAPEKTQAKAPAPNQAETLARRPNRICVTGVITGYNGFLAVVLALAAIYAAVQNKTSISTFIGNRISPKVSSSYENWYPETLEVQGANGATYSTVLVPLPKPLGGIADSDKRYVNHVFAMLVKIVQAKQEMWQALVTNQHVKKTYEKYSAITAKALKKIHEEPLPQNLQAFESSLDSAVQLQTNFFRKAVKLRTSKSSMDPVLRIPEAGFASKRIEKAWQQMEKTYPAWSDDTRESIYCHLHAIDLF